MIKVAKFGGSSLANASQFKKVKDILNSDKDRRFVVVSAPGKWENDRNKITDLLYLLDAHETYHVDSTNVFEIIKKRYVDIKDELNIDYDIGSELDDFYKNISKLNQSEIVSRGEYFSAKLMAKYLGYNFVDSKDVIIFNHNKTVDLEETKRRLDSIIETKDNFVFPGFYGSNKNGNITLFSRGGSDITGAILAKLMNADIYENWTDVSGFLMADPKIIDNPKGIKEISYSELRELSYMGANVLHEESILPVKEANIPIHILNTNRPEDFGTIIMDMDKNSSPYDITGISGRRDFLSINIFKQNMTSEIGYIRKVLSIFESYNVAVQHIPSGIDSFSVIVAKKDLGDLEYDIIYRIKQELSPDDIHVTHDLALVSTVGVNMSKKPGTSGKLFGALGENGINISMISQGADEINITVGVSNDDFEKTIKVIYSTFVKED